MDNHSLIERIKTGDGEQELQEIYRRYRNEFLLWAVKNHSCTMEEAKDVFQQVIVIFYENIVTGKLIEISTQMKTYLFSIGKNKIQELLRSKTKRTPSANSEYYIDTTMFFGEGEENYEELLKKVEASLDQLGDPCKSLLIQFYYHKKSMQEISTGSNYKNSDTVKNLKYKCLQRLKKIYNSDFEALNTSRL